MCLNDDEEPGGVREADLMRDFDSHADDEDWDIDVYCQAVILLSSRISDSSYYFKLIYLFISQWSSVEDFKLQSMRNIRVAYIAWLLRLLLLIVGLEVIEMLY
jgi:hypothetical protein